MLPWYLVAVHGAHAIVEAVLDWPAAQAVQLDAPTVASVLVYEPAAQLEHEETFDAVEYFPAVHAVQLLAPVPVPVFVREPAAQAMQFAVVPAPTAAYEAAGHAPLHVAAVPWPLSAYRPALQLEHAATFDTVEYFPAAHAV